MFTEELDASDVQRELVQRVNDRSPRVERICVGCVVVTGNLMRYFRGSQSIFRDMIFRPS